MNIDLRSKTLHTFLFAIAVDVVKDLSACIDNFKRKHDQVTTVAATDSIGTGSMSAGNSHTQATGRMHHEGTYTKDNAHRACVHKNLCCWTTPRFLRSAIALSAAANSTSTRRCERGHWRWVQENPACRVLPRHIICLRVMTACDPRGIGNLKRLSLKVRMTCAPAPTLTAGCRLPRIMLTVQSSSDSPFW